MNLKKYFLIITAFLITCAHAGSFFSASSQGIGIRRYTVSVRGLGMGGTGLASPDSIALTDYSLSKWRQTNDTRATVGFQYLRFDTQLNDINFTTATSYIGSLNLAIPIKTNKVILGLSLSPYSNVDFRYILTIQDQGITYDEFVFLRGSISKARVSLIWSPFSSLGISLNGNYYIGTIDDQYRLSFNNSQYFNSFHEVEYRFKGPGVGLSLDYQLHKRFMLAGFVDFKPSIDLKRALSSSLSQEDTDITSSGSFPIHYGIGTSIRVHPRLSFSLDYSRQNWSEGFGLSQSQSTSGDAFTDSQLDDWYHLGIGLERNSRTGRNRSFFDLVDWRTGFSMTSLGYKFNNEPVIQYAGHFGIGIPFSQTNRVDIAIAAGIRGDKSKNLAEEQFMQFEISVTMGELWFQQLR